MATAQGAGMENPRPDQPQERPEHVDAGVNPPPARSRSGSIRSLFSRSRHNSAPRQEERPPSPPHEHQEREEDRGSVHSEFSVLDSRHDMSQEQKIHFEFTKKHPMGTILLGMYRDSLTLADRAGIQEMSCSLTELCKNFYSTMNMEKDNMQKNLRETAEQIQHDILNREINSHMMQLDFPVPKHYSPHPSLKYPIQRGEAIKVFPVKGKKFSGSNESGSPGIIEFLSNMNTAQEQCQLSEKEFKEFLLLCTTGYAHSLIIDWVNHEENVPTLYHNLLTFFDKRLSPEDARESLLKMKAAKYINLNKLVAKILSLAGRASSVLPPGEAQKSYFNSEAINALLHSLPPTSSALARNQLVILAAKLAGPVSFNVLCKSLNIFKNQIDDDIKKNGTESERKIPKFMGKTHKWNNGTNKHNEQPVSYSVNTPPVGGSKFEDNRGYQRGPNRDNNTPRPTFQRQNNFQARNQGQNGGNHFQRGNNYRGNHKKSWGNRPGSQNHTLNYCSLCGHKDHKAADGCPFMVADNGKPIATLPMLGTCSVCPPSVHPKLHHPIPLCPFRTSGPLHGSK